MNRTSRLGWLAAPLMMACGGYSTTTRLVNGETIAGNPVAPQAYALYLEATLKEAAGDLPTARATYLEATQFDGHDAELWTRVADLSCRLELPSADDEFANALSEDRWYAPAWVARSRCELKRGNAELALEYARLAQISAPNDFETTEALAAVHARTGESGGALRQWVAYTTLRPTDRRGWQRLAETSERFRNPVWRAWAAAALGEMAVAPEPGAQLPAALVDALLRDDISAVRAYATDHSLSQVMVLEWGLDFGRHDMALVQARVLVAAYPTSTDVRALALLAAARAKDDAALELWSRAPEELTPLTDVGKRALHALLRERCGVTIEELSADGVVRPGGKPQN